MTPENFCYWLQGLLEVGNPDRLNKREIEIIKQHLDIVFNKPVVVNNFRDPNLNYSDVSVLECLATC